jgi:hypothetical protein
MRRRLDYVLFERYHSFSIRSLFGKNNLEFDVKSDMDSQHEEPDWAQTRGRSVIRNAGQDCSDDDDDRDSLQDEALLGMVVSQEED